MPGAAMIHTRHMIHASSAARMTRWSTWTVAPGPRARRRAWRCPPLRPGPGACCVGTRCVTSWASTVSVNRVSLRWSRAAHCPGILTSHAATVCEARRGLGCRVCRRWGHARTGRRRLLASSTPLTPGGPLQHSHEVDMVLAVLDRREMAVDGRDLLHHLVAD